MNSNLNHNSAKKPLIITAIVLLCTALVMLCIFIVLEYSKHQNKDMKTEPSSTVTESTPVPTEEAVSEESLPAEEESQFVEFYQNMPSKYIHSSGIGAWAEYLTISPDGSFKGFYYDTDIGEYQGTPCSLTSYCTYQGVLSVPQQIDTYTYSATIQSLDLTNVPEGEFFAEDTLYTFNPALHVLNEGDTIYIYLPGKPTNELSQEFLLWNVFSEKEPVLSSYAISSNDDRGFFQVDFNDDDIMIPQPDESAPAAQTPDVTAEQSLSGNYGAFDLTFPEHWNSLVTYQQNSQPDFDSWQFIQKKSLERTGNGHLFSVYAFKNSNYLNLPSYSLLGYDASATYIAVYPTDVNYDVSDVITADEYQSLFDEIPGILSTFHLHAPAAAPAGSDFVFPNSSTAPLSEADLAGVPYDKLRIAKNEIYARHGRLFKDAALQEYFNGKSWYKGTIPPDQFSENLLNDIERSNVNMIQRVLGQ